MLSCRSSSRNRRMSSFRVIPSIEAIVERPFAASLVERHGRARVLDAARRSTDALRDALRETTVPIYTQADAMTWLEERISGDLTDRSTASLRRVINATGVILHTNLGRAPLADDALARVAGVAGGYSNLEYDVREGRRGRRDVHAESLLCELTGAGAAAVANNNAGATLLVLAALAAGREVIVSRGELVEIGGGFRVPDVMAQSGAMLREVGTTNRTRTADYAAAISDRTGLILRVHPSNFRVEGFTERPPLDDLAALARRFDLPLFEDQGSGWLGVEDAGAAGLRDEPSVIDSLRAGASLVAFSGDKLLGGPQAGIVVGERDLIDRVARHPLMRAFRTDKQTYAALEATLALWVQPSTRLQIPVYRMLTMPLAEIERRASLLAARFAGTPGLHCEVVDGASKSGGGSAPASQLPTRLIALTCDGVSASALEARLRAHDPPVIARIQDERVLIDLRTVALDEEVDIARALTGTI